MSGDKLSQDTTLEFQSDKQALDASTLAAALSNISDAIDGVNKEVGGAKSLRVEVYPFKKGSFIVPLRLFLPPSAQGLSMDTVVTPSEILNILSQMVGVYAGLKGEMPAKVAQRGTSFVLTSRDSAEVELSEQAYRVYARNSSIPVSLNRHFKSLELNPDIIGFSMGTGDSEAHLFEVPRQQFPFFVPRPLLLEEEESPTRIKEVDTTLALYEIVFDTRRRWEFIYEGRKIKAAISDEAFVSKMLGGEPFSNGDRLEVRLRITQEFLKQANIYQDRDYEIVKVVRHRPRPEQLELGI